MTDDDALQAAREAVLLSSNRVPHDGGCPCHCASRNRERALDHYGDLRAAIARVEVLHMAWSKRFVEQADVEAAESDLEAIRTRVQGLPS